MPPHSARSVSTVTTVEDVFDQMERDLDVHAGLSESRRYVQKITKGNAPLGLCALQELQSPVTFFSVIVPDASRLLVSMSKYGAILGGIQATSYFYPIADITGASWDFFCTIESNKYDNFSTEFRQYSGANLLEDIRHGNDKRVMYLRKSMNGSQAPINIRIIGTKGPPLAMILELRESYRQSYISSVVAMCFWPSLMKRSQYRVLESNRGLDGYPLSKTSVATTINKRLNQIRRKEPQKVPSVHVATDDRVESVVFEDVDYIDKATHKTMSSTYINTVYSIFNGSTRYLGTVGNMK